MSATATAPIRTAKPLAPAPTPELVLKRNSIERLKKEKPALEVIHDLPQLIETGYENVSEEDIVRLQWYGLYHDKPKLGYFMMRIKLPSGIITPVKLRTLGEMALQYGRDFAELSTRQNVQLHWFRLEHLPDVFATLDRAGLSTAGGCGDTVRNITGCPVAGISAEELFDCTPTLDDAANFFYGNPDYTDLPRKHKISIATCPHQCNAPELNCINLIGVRQNGRDGYALRLGGGLSSTPRLSRHIGVFIPKDEAMSVLRAILDAWKSDLRYRLSRVKARMKFMVDDYGPEGMRTLIEDRLERRLEDLEETPVSPGETDHMGIHAQKQAGLNYIGFPVKMGVVSGKQMVQLADLAESIGGDIRLTRQQNFILAGVPDAQVDSIVERVAEIGFPLGVNRIHANGIACTGSPLCNYAVAETKGKMHEIVNGLEAKFGSAVEDLKVHVDGCPHACTHHWVGDLGLHGTTLRERTDGGDKIEAYEIYLRGGYGGADAQIGKPLLRRVPAEEAPQYVERLVAAYVGERESGERFRDFTRRKSDEELISIGSGRPLDDVVAEMKTRKPHLREREEAGEV
jgi:sulfite reductase beta subunit-like hemoprotein